MADPDSPADARKSESGAPRLARSAGVFGLATIASRILGLAREQVMAYYFGAAIMGQDDRPSSDELHKFLVSKGVDVQAGTAWTYKVSDGFTVGMAVEEVAADE